MLVVGIDEVGRGCIAGPLVIAAVVLDHPIDGLNDSKLLSRNRRRELTKVIYKNAVFIGIGWVTVDELNNWGLSLCLTIGAERALNGLTSVSMQIVLDGNFNYIPKQYSVKTLIGADKIEPAVMAASIVAKVARDEYMIALAKKYPDFGFDKHVGYCTALHRQALERFGYTQDHRLQFEPVKSLYLQKKSFVMRQDHVAAKEPAK